MIAYAGGERRRLEAYNYCRNHRVAKIEMGKKRNKGVMLSHDRSVRAVV